jgi:hypothetical protein
MLIFDLFVLIPYEVTSYSNQGGLGSSLKYAKIWPMAKNKWQQGNGTNNLHYQIGLDPESISKLVPP